ncbi:alpha/beta fold hydrolase [Micromonospora sp. NPDC005215]|uniref:thioesterase II family protein n=1 Tax=Micromonospora sp. NPDC005215 TaxID=3157024 RepID=UPI0033AD5C36
MTSTVVDPGRWLRRFHPAPKAATERLLLFPHAGGAASFYLPYSATLSGRFDVLAVQYPGRQERRSEAQVSEIGALAEQIAEALAGPDDRPLTFFGHSMGAIVAYEVALRLEHAGRPAPAHLFASGRRAPSRYREERIHQRDAAGVLAEVVELGGTDPAVLRDPELVAMVMPALRADYTAIESYRHRPGQRVTCPITAIFGDADPRTSEEEAQAWAEHTSGPFALHKLPGDHFYLVAGKDAVVRILDQQLSSPVRPS